MSGQRVGYVRVSTLDQRTARQLEGVAVDRTFVERASGRDVTRPELAALVDFVREGDTVVVHSMDRLARSLDDLRSIVAKLTGKGVALHVVTEALTFTGEERGREADALVDGRLRRVRALPLRERQYEGIELAKARGVYRGRTRSLSEDQVADLRRRIGDGVAKAVAARELELSRETLHQALLAPSRADPGEGPGAVADAPAEVSV